MLKITYIAATAVFIVAALTIVSWSLGLGPIKPQKQISKEQSQVGPVQPKEAPSLGTVSGKDGSAMVTGIVVHKIEDGQVNGLVLGVGQPERLLIRFPSDATVLLLADNVTGDDRLVAWNTVGQGNVVRVTVAKNDGKRVFLFNPKNK